MKKKNQPLANTSHVSRRHFFSLASAATLGLSSMSFRPPVGKAEVVDPERTPSPVKLEWRNRQEGMAYRQLGRTGMMISEVVNGGDPVRPDSWKQVEIALERGVNYLDMAPAYGGGDCEKAYSKILDSSSKRMKVFLTTKVSGFSSVRDQLYQEIFKELPSEKQKAIMEKARAMRDERGVDKPGYYLTYWPGQDRSMDPSYVSNAMMEDYAHRVEGSKAFQKKIVSSLEGSLERTGTDHFDILMCPHGANAPEEVQIPEIFSTFEKLKTQGKVRFLGVSTHNDPAGVLRAAAASGKYDVAMCAYNIINGGYLEDAIREAYQKGMGIIGMKVAMAVATHHEAIKPIPNWRIEKVDRIVPGDLKPPLKAYLWALQNPHISAVISNLWNEDFINENLSIVGTKVELQPG